MSSFTAKNGVLCIDAASLDVIDKINLWGQKIKDVRFFSPGMYVVFVCMELTRALPRAFS